MLTQSCISTVAGGCFYLNSYYDNEADWQSVVNYVRNHEYDEKGRLQVGIRNEEGGHAINFLRYANVNGQDRIYVYDNNCPDRECYLYLDSYGYVREAPYSTFEYSIKCVVLRDIRTYFKLAPGYDLTRVVYVPKDAITIPGYKYYYIDGKINGEEYVGYEIPESVDRITIISNKENATFRYMGKEYGFGKITDDTLGQLKLSSKKQSGESTDAEFKIFKVQTTP